MLESVGLGEDLGSSGMPKYLEMLWIFPKIVSFNIFHKVKAKTNAMVLKNLPFSFLNYSKLVLYFYILLWKKKKNISLWWTNAYVQLHLILWKKVHEQWILWDRTMILKWPMSWTLSSHPEYNVIMMNKKSGYHKMFLF